MSDTKEDAPPKKKGKLGKMLIMGVGLLALLGGGMGAGLYAANSGLIGGGGHGGAEDHGPKLIPKAEQKRSAEGGDGGEHGGGGEGGGESGGGHGESGEAAPEEHAGLPSPTPGVGGERYASNYFAMEKEFTSNLTDSVHFIQVGIAVSTPYDDTVINNLKTNDIAVRSAILMTLGDTTEEQVFSSAGKKQLQKRLADSINQVLRQKEGFGGISNVYFTNFVVQ
ncbi:flagellar basal body-associated FliL family protein [Sphingomonas carotinifaciens]|uniref:flagellar basal body-associated FliL family protein n=1 Tax=Sphingomonas carotinifaciens TaxID=1166323 RepID=UPI000DDBACB3|nr:flagellar basal body-associated FliL family protein [Sphingomonas carotinifaciens]